MQVLSVTELILLLVLSLDFSKAVYVFERAVQDSSQNNQKNIDAYRGAVDYSYVIKIGSTMQYLPLDTRRKTANHSNYSCCVAVSFAAKVKGQKRKEKLTHFCNQRQKLVYA